MINPTNIAKLSRVHIVRHMFPNVEFPDIKLLPEPDPSDVTMVTYTAREILRWVINLDSLRLNDPDREALLGNLDNLDALLDGE